MKELFWLEELPQEIDNKYLVVNIAAKRARQLRDGAIPTVRTRRCKETTVALDEVFMGMLKYQVQPIEKILVPPESVADYDDDHDIPEARLSDIDGAFKVEEEEDIFEAEYVDDSKYHYDDDDDEYEEGI